MKRHITLALVALFFAIGLSAQTAKPNTMRVTLKSGQQQDFSISDVEDVTFVELTTVPTDTVPTDTIPENPKPNTPDEPDPIENMPAIRIQVPVNFTESYVMQAVYQGVKVAEICYEYIRYKATPEATAYSTKRCVVVYRAGQDGRAYLSKGFSATDGGQVEWDVENNKATFTPGTEAAQVATVYIYDGKISTVAPEGEVADATVKAELLSDIRGKEENVYRIVKIGTQYWMAQNLATEYFLDGTQIPTMTSNDVALWKANTTGANHIYGDNNDFLTLYGRLYNGYAVFNEKGLAPEGWQVPSLDEWNALKTYAGASAAIYKDSTPLSWLNDGEGTNLTGFEALPGGWFQGGEGGGDMNEGQDAYFWSTTSAYDFLSRENTIGTARLNNKATGFAISTADAGHSYRFGHSVRCIRKQTSTTR